MFLWRNRGQCYSFGTEIPVALLRALPLAGLLVLAACSETPEPAMEDAPGSLVPEVTVQELTPQTWQTSVSTFGVVEALEEVNVAAELSGTVSAVHINEGDRVKAGDLLLELDPEKREFALEQARQQVQHAQAALKEARLKLQRRRNLAEQETISKEVLDSAQLAVDLASAAYQQALSSAQLAERELADTRIFSPTDGLVDIRAVEVGEPVQVGASLVTLQAVQGLRVQTWVSEADIARIRAGDPAQVTVSGLAGRVFAATIEWVGVNADPATGNFPVKLILSGETDALRPGMTASAELQGINVPDALLLPESALVDRDRRRVVFVVEDGVAHLREPLLAAGFSNRLQVLAGLEAGDEVVVAGQSLLLDGDAVTVRRAD
ncbi:MAG: efflux RND transporter periplasmic adaptor subunit [Halioglobus sp.]|nr:efflux RND transporter periplasmic adaptor subunit [Halioglobus sp.]